MLLEEVSSTVQRVGRIRHISLRVLWMQQKVREKSFFQLGLLVHKT